MLNFCLMLSWGLKVVMKVRNFVRFVEIVKMVVFIEVMLSVVLNVCLFVCRLNRVSMRELSIIVVVMFIMSFVIGVF